MVPMNQSEIETEELKQEEGKVAPVDIYDTDVGELLKVPKNPRWKEFVVEKPMKNSDYVTYEVSGYDMKGNF